MEKQWILPHTEEKVSATNGIYRVLIPSRLDYISYPYEWCFDQLKDAALLTLRIQETAMQHGMSIKDASAFNVQFSGSQPIFIDTLSFELDERPFWIAYRQFCEHFLGPLLLMSYISPECNRLWRASLDGISLALVSGLLPVSSFWRPGALMHIHLHAWMMRKQALAAHNAWRGNRRRADRKAVIVESLKATVERTGLRNKSSAWSSYYSEATHFSSLAWLMREKLFVVMLVFTVSGLAVDIALRFAPERAAPLRLVFPRAAHAHPPLVLYIILDEQIGPGGFPRNIRETASAAAEMERTFAQWNFRLYANAYSNYPTTLDSVPSILNRSLLKQHGQFFLDQADKIRAGPYSLHQNRMFASYAALGNRIKVYQYRPIDFSHGPVTVESTTEYWDSLEGLNEVQGPWYVKLRWVVGNYQRTDPLLDHLAGFFPFRFGSHTVGPLGLRRVWPQQLAYDFVTLTLVYLIAFMIAGSRSYAYLDPGSASILLQVLVGGVLAIAATVRLYWSRIKEVLQKSRTAPDP